jgi:hypothetical protein
MPSDGYVQVATDGSGKKLQTYENTVDGVANVHAQGTVLVDENGTPLGYTGLRDTLVAQRYTALSDSLADGIAGFWTQTVSGGGAINSTGGEGALTTSTGATGSAQLVSTNVVYYPGQVNWMNSALRFGDTGVANNIRRVGMFTVTGTTPQNGCYFELDGTSLYAVTVKGATATRVLSTSWSRATDSPFTLTANYHSFEIRYTANTVWFFVDNVLRHNVSGTSASLTNTLTMPIVIQNIKTSGGTDIGFYVRNIGNGRFGAPGGVVAETGLSAVEALAVGGGTPHDSVDTGSPVKIGGVARSTTPTAVADGDRVSGWFSQNGAQIVVPQTDTGRTAVTFTAAGLTSGTSTTKVMVTMNKSTVAGAAVSSASSFVITSGKRFRITNISVSVRAMAATVAIGLFELVINTAGAAVVGSPTGFTARAATPATTGIYDHKVIPIPDGLEILGNGTLQFGIAYTPTWTTTASQYDVVITGFEY